MTPEAFVKLAKLLFGFLIILIIGLLSAACWYQYQEKEKLQTVNTSLTKTVTDLKHDLELIQIGQQAMGLGQLLADEKKDALSKKSKEVRDTIKQKETDIDKTISDPAERAKAKSIVRMNGVWDMYCQLQPDNSVCKAKGVAP